MNRKQFMRTGIVTALFPAMTLRAGTQMGTDEKLDPLLVKEFVGKAHTDIDRVKVLLANHPTLLNAAHDWKRGDFETALGAASHVGNKEIVNFLIASGAQTNIFTACLFGQLEVVKSLIQLFPDTLHALGPHGFTLLHHAERGGDENQELVKYLKGLGLTRTKVTLY
ncbi:ankyrin repeat domain-containing protein [Zhouia amylolytica]|uniref:Uncharacterized protein n=1 Tax=Zhouia amylolytica AD3 TaxID=1286632 RepID=W2UR91_9FLAO|nr:ankyrin repeat domain-containing protein [Zhouia amylolytica]ETN95822.1 hypothetical protein P278_15440 [Zhouia amylolytica AD3]MCQ0112041.1 hypothetical protein [Zhouia amylolytica]